MKLTKSHLFLELITLSIFYCVQSSDFQKCRVSSKEGICKSIYECLPVVSSLKQNNTIPVYCSEEEEIVCCPKTFENQRNARISEKKCMEYLKYTFEQVKSLPDDPEDEFEISYVDRCAMQAQQYAIVGGEDASLREYPHMVAIGDNNIQMEGIENFTLWFCGGSLISEKFVITAAHCVMTNKVVRGNSISPRVVKLGALDLDIDETNVRIYEVQEKIVYPEYANQFVYHDIGLLKLKKNVEFNINIRPICLSTDKSIQHNHIWATGWGKYKGAGYEGILQKLQLPLVSNDNCKKVYNAKRTKRLPQGLNEKILCYGAMEGADTCPGASGGPVQVANKNVYCSYFLVGITSAGVRCTEGYPGLFTKVSEYIDWIEAIVWNSDTL